MNQDAIDGCIRYIISGIIREITPVQKSILCVGYPMNTEEEMIETIKNRAKFIVLNYTVQQNTPKNQGESLKNINTF